MVRSRFSSKIVRLVGNGRALFELAMPSFVFAEVGHLLVFVVLVANTPCLTQCA